MPSSRNKGAIDDRFPTACGHLHHRRCRRGRRRARDGRMLAGVRSRAAARRRNSRANRVRDRILGNPQAPQGLAATLMNPSSAAVAAASNREAMAIGRGRFFFWLFLLAAANGMADMAIQWTIGHGLERALIDCRIARWLGASCGLAICAGPGGRQGRGWNDRGGRRRRPPSRRGSASAVSSACCRLRIATASAARTCPGAIIFLALKERYWGRLRLDCSAGRC